MQVKGRKRKRDESGQLLPPRKRSAIPFKIGDRVEVQWEDGLYEGEIVNVKPRKQQFQVRYDDGDLFWEDYDPVLNSIVTP